MKSALIKLLLIGFISLFFSSLSLANVIIPQFVGSIDTKTFQQCQNKLSEKCNSKKDYASFMQCFTAVKIKTQNKCEQFFKFAEQANWGLRDKLDTLMAYNHNKLYLLHVVRWGANYPGDYYIINSLGQYIAVNSEGRLREIHLQLANNYQQIMKDYPRATIWGIIDQLPTTQSLGNGRFQFIFSYQVLNGCHACERAGYANVAFNFAKSGRFTGIKLLSITENPKQNSR